MNKNEIKQRFSKLFSIDIFTKGAGFLLLPIYLNLMTQEEFGNYSYIFSIVGMLGFVFGMGQHATINRFYHSDEHNSDTLIENLHLVLFSSFLFFSSLLIIFQSYFVELFFKFSIGDTLYFTMILLATLMALNKVFMSYLYQSENIKLVQKKNIFDFFITNIIAISFLYFLSYSKDELRIFAITLASIISLTIFYKKFISKSHLKFANRSKVFYKRILFNGFPMAVGSFANFFISFGDRFVIEKLLDKVSLGIFSFTMVMVGILMMIFGVFQNVWLPYFFKEKNLDRSFKRVYKIIFLFLSISIAMGIGLHFLVYILSNYFIEYSYIKSLDFLWILVVASFFQICSMIMGGFYQIFEISYIGVPINILAGALNIYLNYHFIVKYGLIGAAVSTLLISFLLFMIHFSLVHYYRIRGSHSEYFSKYTKR